MKTNDPIRMVYVREDEINTIWNCPQHHDEYRSQPRSLGHAPEDAPECQLEHVVYFRKCDYEPCGKGMNEGFVIGGADTYCSLEHMTAAEGITEAEYIKLHDEGQEDGMDSDAAYWTQWEERDYDDAPLYSLTGQLIAGE